MKQKQIIPQVLAARVLGDSEMHAELRAALNSMRNQRIPFTGPFLTAKGRIVVATGKFLLTGNELIELMERGQLDATGIEALVGRAKWAQEKMKITTIAAKLRKVAVDMEVMAAMLCLRKTPSPCSVCRGS